MASPGLNLPAGSNAVEVSLIDTTFDIVDCPSAFFMGPEIKGFEKFAVNAYGLLVTHTDRVGKQSRLIFDLGPPKNWEVDLPSELVERIKSWNSTIKIDKYVSEILEDHGIPLREIEAIIWSHPHWDHVGRPSLFPSSTKLVTGPGVLEKHGPSNPKAELLAREFQGREVEELDFSTSKLSIGGFRALDYFHDGSFYLLEAPGHCVGHMVGLARTTPTSSTEKATYLLMGADSFHHPSQLRPSSQLPLPSSISFAADATNLREISNPCPGEFFHAIHPSQHLSTLADRYKDYIHTHMDKPSSSPFLTISQAESGFTVAVDIDQARETIRKLQAFDAHEDVLVVAAHDRTLVGLVEVLPATANDWKQKEWKEKGRWAFLNDLVPAAGLAA